MTQQNDMIDGSLYMEEVTPEEELEIVEELKDKLKLGPHLVALLAPPVRSKTESGIVAHKDMYAQLLGAISPLKPHMVVSLGPEIDYIEPGNYVHIKNTTFAYEGPNFLGFFEYKDREFRFFVVGVANVSIILPDLDTGISHVSKRFQELEDGPAKPDIQIVGADQMPTAEA